MDQLTSDLLPPVAGTNHGQATVDAVQFAQNYVRNAQTTSPPTYYAGMMGDEVSYFAQNGLVSPLSQS